MARRGKIWQPSSKDREVVKRLVAAGVPQVAIAAALGITKPTLERRLRLELDLGHIEAVDAVARSMFQLAVKGRPMHVRYQAAAFWLKCRAGWRDTDRPMSLAAMVPVSQMSDAEFNEVLRVNGLPPINGPQPAGDALNFPPGGRHGRK